MSTSNHNMIHFDPLMKVADDGHFIPEVRAWSLEKYKLVGSYCDIFTTGMKWKWDQLIYIDLFAGAGYARIKETKKIYKSSALIAMSVPNPFTKYILCEQDPERFEALKTRVEKDYGHLNYALFQGDSNQNIETVIKSIPAFKRGNTLLPFCFVDPYSLDLSFLTIAKLGKNLMDFLILQALHMDANRNFEKYMKDESLKIENYLGLENWREVFEQNGCAYRNDFVKFLADQYQLQMSRLGYTPEKHMHQIRSNEKNLPLYYLSFYSKHPRGEDYFTKVQQRVKQQLSLDF
jgi:three-Cys-motif partner protein